MTTRQEDTAPVLLSTGKAARLIGLTGKALYRYEEQGLITCIRSPGGHRRWRRDEVEALMTRPGAA